MKGRATPENSATMCASRDACYLANETAQRAAAAPFHAIEDSWYCPVMVKIRPATEHANATKLPMSTRFFFMATAPFFWNVLFLMALIPPKLAGFWNSDDADSVVYIRLKVKRNRKSPYFRAFSGFMYLIKRIKKFSSPKIKIRFEPMFFSRFFCGFERCGSLSRARHGRAIGRRLSEFSRGDFFLKTLSLFLIGAVFLN